MTHPAPAAEALLPDDLAMGAVRLIARDVAALRAFYADAVGLDLLESADGTVVLGSEGQPLLVLVPDRDAVLEDPRSAGLFHSALRFADPAHLSAALTSLSQAAPASFIGASDHLVSLAFYFRDPEGNELELYTDRPRDQWRWDGGRVVMANAFVDPQAFVAEHPPAPGPLSGVDMGHVHLRVGDIAAAHAFYVDVLGFAVTAEWDSALFVSAGGYHHHLAANTWRSAGAGRRTGGTTGLAAITVGVGSPGEVAAVAGRLAAADIPHEAGDGHLITADPWGNQVRITT